MVYVLYLLIELFVVIGMFSEVVNCDVGGLMDRVGDVDRGLS